MRGSFKRARRDLEDAKKRGEELEAKRELDEDEIGSRI